MLSIEDSENENDRFQLAFKTEGGKTTKIPIGVLFIWKLTGTPVLTPLDTMTNNYQLAVQSVCKLCQSDQRQNRAPRVSCSDYLMAEESKTNFFSASFSCFSHTVKACRT